jgi:hypothetical protein
MMPSAWVKRALSFEMKKQYSQSRLQIGPDGLASTWNETGAVGG